MDVVQDDLKGHGEEAFVHNMLQNVSLYSGAFQLPYLLLFDIWDAFDFGLHGNPEYTGGGEIFFPIIAYWTKKVNEIG